MNYWEFMQTKTENEQDTFYLGILQGKKELKDFYSDKEELIDDLAENAGGVFYEALSEDFEFVAAICLGYMRDATEIRARILNRLVKNRWENE
jgi:hypothetical protein